MTIYNSILNSIFFNLVVITTICSCNSKPGADNNINSFDTLFAIQSQSLVDSLTFDNFLNYVNGEGQIPIDFINKFVSFDSVTIDTTKSKFIGSGAWNDDYYYVVYIKQGNLVLGHNIIITYSKKYEQIDIVSFVYYCENCSGQLLGELSFLSEATNNEFVVDYYKSSNLKGKPIMSNEIAYSERWWISPHGSINKR